MTFEEQRAIQEEVRNTGIAEAGDKVQALRDEKAADKVLPAVGAPVPGRDSGFCSEQDQLAQQTQGQKKTPRHAVCFLFILFFLLELIRIYFAPTKCYHLQLPLVEFATVVKLNRESTSS